MEKHYKIFKTVFISLFVIYITLYLSQATGYYEYKNYERMVLTKEQIKKFEDDVKKGKKVDVSDYVTNKDRSYQNSISKLGLNLSNFISSNIKKGIYETFDLLGKFVTEEK